MTTIVNAQLKQYFYNPVCINCGSFFVLDHLFCHFCFTKHIETNLEIKASQVDATSEHYYLFDWVPGQSDLISEMVYRFKSDRAIKAWRFYSDVFAQQILDCIDVQSFDAIVPLPGSSQSSVHSAVFAKFLSQHLKLPVFHCLEKVIETGEQKLKTAQQRTDQSTGSPIVKLEQFTHEDTANLKLIYVDDIMTTGATFKRSQEALQNENNSILATLFYRPKAIQT